MENDPLSFDAKPASKSIMRPIAIGCVSVVVIIAGLVVFGFHLSKQMKDTEPYKIAIKRLKDDPRVATLLGGLIKDEPVVTGKITLVGDRGNAGLEFRLYGKKTNASVRVLATLADGVWTVDLLEIVGDDGQKLMLEGGKPEAEK